MYKHTIKNFLDGSVCVRCTALEDKQRLLQVCTEAGITKTYSSILDIQQIVLFHNVFYIDRKARALACISETTSKFCNAVPFSSLANNASSRRIVIEYSDNSTTATLYNGEKAVKSATINRCHNDKPSVHVAAVEVIDKLLAKQVKQPKDTAKPEKPVEKDGFKVGDRVVCVGEISNPAVAGKHGTVMYINNIDCIGIQFDEYVDGHGLESACLRLAIKHGHGWWCKGENLRHEQPTKQNVREVKRLAKAGEYIKLTKSRYSFDEVGLILRIDKVNGCAFVLQKNHPASDARAYSNFPWAYRGDDYVVLEGYQPEEPANA